MNILDSLKNKLAPNREKPPDTMTENAPEVTQSVSSGGTIGEEQIAKANETLNQYKDGKQNLENRITTDETYYRLQYASTIKDKTESKNKTDRDRALTPHTAWLLNSIINKHADLMDNYPVASCLPRERQDEQDAEQLSEIIPVIMEYNKYEAVYSNQAWYYLKHGISCQGVFWDSSLENGLGDITIKNVDILNLFWEPGITDLQDSANVFYVSLVDNDILTAAYPDINKADLSGGDIEVSKYALDDDVDTENKTLVVDWYYRKKLETGKTVLHYCKYVGNTILFASENTPGFENGYYEHGKYPFILSVMYPEAGSISGFGIISIAKDPQMYIDILDGFLLDYTNKCTKPRYWGKKTMGINKKQFLDWDNPIVDVEENIDEEKLKQIQMPTLPSVVANLRQAKIDELKETSSNRDFSQGGTSSGITSGAAIATLQEAGNKTSRDMIKGLYRGYVQAVQLVIELIRQFYDESRTFRIVGENGGYEFVDYNNANIKQQQTGFTPDGQQTFRQPIFDIDIRAEKSNPFSRMSQNETAVNLYKLGAFNPQNAQMVLGMLDVMDFEGKEKVRDYVSQGQTAQTVITQQQMQMEQMTQIITQLGGGQLLAQMQMQQQMMQQAGQQPQQPRTDTKVTMPTAVNNASNLKQSSYTQSLIDKARLDVSGG